MPPDNMNDPEFPDPKEPIHLLDARDRWQAITELFDILVAARKIPARDRPTIENAVRRREVAMSTAIGRGIGIPHALSDLVKEPVAAFGRSKYGINFDAHDGKLVFKVCLFLLPQGQFQKHLHLMANISKRLASPDFPSERKR